MLNRSGLHVFVALAALASAPAIASAEGAAAPAAPAPAMFVRPNTMVIKTVSVSHVSKGVIDSTHSYWVPSISFRIQGPIASGTAISVDFLTPAGKTFLKAPAYSVPSDIPAGYYFDYAWAAGVDQQADGQSTAGMYGVKISAKNELMGTPMTELYNATFDVKKARSYPDNNTPSYKNLVDFYVDYDWALATAYLETFHLETNNGNYVMGVPTLDAYIWFRDDGRDQYNTNAFLFYKGAKIDEWVGAAHSKIELLPGSTATAEFAWRQYQFVFQKTLLTANASSSATFFMDKNPGDYEIKVLRNGKLDRSIKFTVAADGKVPDPFNQISRTVDRYLVAAKVLPETEGKVDVNAYKKGAFFGHPVDGFSAE